MKFARAGRVRRKNFRSDPAEKLSDSDWRIRRESQQNTTNSFRISSDFDDIRTGIGSSNRISWEVVANATFTTSQKKTSYIPNGLAS